MNLTRVNLACFLLGVTALATKATVMAFLPTPIQHTTTSHRVPATFSRHAVSLFQMPDYSERAANFGMADKDVLAETAKLEDVVFVDARGLDEIAEVSLDRPFVHGNFILQGELDHLTKILPSKSAPIIVFCKMGGRAAKVKATLEEQGYSNVLNAGGIGDVDFLS